MIHQPLPNLPCLCGNLRRASRALTQHYENALRPFGLHSTQLTILQALSRAGEIPQRKLGFILAMDTTSLTRTLAIMRRKRLVSDRPGKDRRERLFRLSAHGERELRRVLPPWTKIQSRLRRKLGPRKWNQLFQLAHEVTRVVTTQKTKGASP